MANPFERFDQLFIGMVQETGGVEGLLNLLFGFMYRRTDFYYEMNPGDKMGFAPGVAKQMVCNFFDQYQDEYWKRHGKKDLKDYQKKLETYRDEQKKFADMMEAKKLLEAKSTPALTPTAPNDKKETISEYLAQIIIPIGPTPSPKTLQRTP